MPEDLDCTGLYKDLDAKELSDGVEEFQPAVMLWSDGALKTRWLQLPEGEQIDASDPEAWIFPVGTKAWKEFRIGDKRVETRIYEKQEEDLWRAATYKWNDDESEASRSRGEDLEVDGIEYHIPTADECRDCHDGREDKLLGFEQLALALPGATGLTLAELVDADRLDNFEGSTELTIPDDGTGLSEQTYGWVHMNCGVSCHNGNPTSKGYSRGMRLQLTTAELESGDDPREFAIYKTTIGEEAATLRWIGETRITPGSPEDSLLYRLATTRGNKQQQMPPIASQVVDADFAAVLGEWIAALPAGSLPDESDEPAPE